MFKWESFSLGAARTAPPTTTIGRVPPSEAATTTTISHFYRLFVTPLWARGGSAEEVGL
ncbi:hypothetical protein WN55_09180 [Dufourea novaeangliae]|uniref:Uncharacterized protein n=1 Tax=Dufourea novaeangliae TaxID=178035 RepID=A0A154P8T7_DUFNO|nr:hypothetical protein WN55_09180 [Dufourea novaeangliae]